MQLRRGRRDCRRAALIVLAMRCSGLSNTPSAAGEVQFSPWCLRVRRYEIAWRKAAGYGSCALAYMQRLHLGGLSALHCAAGTAL